MMRYRRPGQIGSLCDLSDAHAMAVIHLHHFYEKVLTVFITYGCQYFLSSYCRML